MADTDTATGKRLPWREVPTSQRDISRAHAAENVGPWHLSVSRRRQQKRSGVSSNADSRDRTSSSRGLIGHSDMAPIIDGRDAIAHGIQRTL